MGLYAFIRTPPRTSPAERLEGRLHLLKELILSLGDDFRLKSISLWVRAPVKSLGGQLIDLGPDVSVEELSLELIRSRVKRAAARRGLFVEAEGVLFLGDGRKMAAYVRLNLSKSWRDLYGDIEFDVYATGNVSDLTDLVIADHELRMTVIGVLKHLAGMNPARVRDAYLGYGSSCIDDMRLLGLVYHDKGSSLIRDVFNTMSLDEEARVLVRRMIPYNRRFLARAIWEAIEGTEGFADLLDRCRIRREEAGSLLLLAERINSFRRFYDALLSGYVEPVIKELPSVEAMNRRIRDAIASTLRLDKFL